MDHAIKGIEDDLRGRVACLETLLTVFAAHIAKYVDDSGGDLVMFTSGVFDDVENSLIDAAQKAVGTTGDAAAIYAISAYRRLSTQMYDHVQREAARRKGR